MELQWEPQGFYYVIHFVNQVMTWYLISFPCEEITRHLRTKRRNLEKFVIIIGEDEFPRQI